MNDKLWLGFITRKYSVRNSFAGDFKFLVMRVLILYIIVRVLIRFINLRHVRD